MAYFGVYGLRSSGDLRYCQYVAYLVYGGVLHHWHTHNTRYPSSRLRIFSAASACIDGNTWLYVSSVSAI